MRALRDEIAKIRDAHTLPEIRKIARQYGREPNRRAKMDRLSQSSHWNDIGALKAEVARRKGGRPRKTKQTVAPA